MSKCVGPCVRVQNGHKPDDCFSVCQNDESENLTMTINEEIHTGYDPRCCHKTVFTRCEGCPYDEIKKA